MSDVSVRPAREDEVHAIAARRRFDDTGLRLARDCARGGRAWIASDDGESVGVALLEATPEEHYVGDVFVEPSFRGTGIGAALLDAALAANEGGIARSVALDPGDPAAAALLLRRGIPVRHAVYRLAGAIPREDVLASMAAGDYRYAVETLDGRQHAYSLDAVDRETRGCTRGELHASFAGAATGSAMLRDDEFVAYAYSWPDGRIGPLAAFSAVYLVQTLALAMVVLHRTYGASWCTLLVPSTNVRLLRAALRAGLRIEGGFLLASDAPEADPARYAGFHPLLF